MNEQISFIVDIQNIDVELSKFDELLRKTLNEIEESRHILKSKESELEKLRIDLLEVNKNISGSQLDIKTYEDKMAKMKDTQKLIKTNKEYNAIQKSIKDNEALKKKSEDEQLSYMENKESIEAEIASIQKDIDKLTDGLSLKNGEYEKNEKEFGVIKKEFFGKREVAKVKIKKDYLDIYEAIKRNKGFPAIASVMKSGACTGCYRMLPPQQFNELISGNIFMQCPVCSRILYIDMDLSEPTPPAEKVSNKAQKTSNKNKK
ncbi:MAG: zinc ribbon domain-containing protein [bacterium]